MSKSRQENQVRFYNSFNIVTARISASSSMVDQDAPSLKPDAQLNSQGEMAERRRDLLEDNPVDRDTVT